MLYLMCYSRRSALLYSICCCFSCCGTNDVFDQFVEIYLTHLLYFKDRLVIPSADLSQSLFKAYFANTMIVDVCHIDISLLIYSQPTRRRKFCRHRIAIVVSGSAPDAVA